MNDILQAIFIEAILSVARNKATDSIFGRTAVTTKAHLLTDYGKAMAYGTAKQAILTKDNTKLERKTDMGYTNGMTELFIKVISSKTYAKGMER